MSNKTKDIIAGSILFVFAATIIIPSATIDGFFLGMALPSLYRMAMVYAVGWALWRFYHRWHED